MEGCLRKESAVNNSAVVVEREEDSVYVPDFPRPAFESPTEMVSRPGLYKSGIERVSRPAALPRCSAARFCRRPSRARRPRPHRGVA